MTISQNLINDDCLEGLKRLKEGSVDMVLTDPPYGTTHLEWDQPLEHDVMWSLLLKVVKNNGAMLFFTQPPYDKILACSNLPLFRYEYIWNKHRGTNFLNAKKMPLKVTENILVFYKTLPVYNPQFTINAPYYKKNLQRRPKHVFWRKDFHFLPEGISDGTRYPKNILDFNAVNYPDFPTQKPVDICQYLISTYTNPGDTILDICAGSGTIPIAAMGLNRKWIAFEKDPKAYKIAKKRIEESYDKMHSGLLSNIPSYENILLN
jgi:site-specific DNA-methyltransferase (adenine-specific)